MGIVPNFHPQEMREDLLRTLWGTPVYVTAANYRRLQSNQCNKVECGQKPYVRHVPGEHLTWRGKHGASQEDILCNHCRQLLWQRLGHAQDLARRRRKEGRPRRQRTTFSNEQTLRLELEYSRSEYISRSRRFELAESLALTETQIKIWFQNRRDQGQEDRESSPGPAVQQTKKRKLVYLVGSETRTPRIEYNTLNSRSSLLVNTDYSLRPHICHRVLAEVITDRQEVQDVDQCFAPIVTLPKRPDGAHEATIFTQLQFAHITLGLF
ncbi:unnamed protein product [Timema podura]|uniref:Homeobox domain-containing protein n=1 Tax=Timema podura TaxID=61482 RepID=A0ABN7NIV1_TIMPD|nr:unnamed protein product [Timema podura]